MTRSELKDIIKECMSELNESVEAVDEEVCYEECDLLVNEKAIFVSKQAKDLKDQIKDIIYENTTRLGGFDKLKSMLFGSSSGIKESEVAKVTAGIEKLFDVCHSTNVISFGVDLWKVDYTAIKGKYMYNFTVNFARTSSKMASLTFNERILDNKSFNCKDPKPVIEFIIKNASKNDILLIKKSTIEALIVTQGKWEPGLKQDEKLYNAAVKKFPNGLRYDDVTGKLRFSLSGEI